MSSFAKQNLKGVTVYNLTFGKTAEQWKEEQRSGHIHSLRYNEAFRTRVEFIQDAVFPTASTKLQISENGQWMLAIGTYPPKLKMFDLCELSMKFERGVESEAIDFCFLSADWEKFVVLRDFRWMEFHTRHGRHYNMRMPLIGTCMMYNAPMCELYTGTIKNIVLRANLEQGRYFSPFETSLDYINCCDIDTTHLLTAFGGLNGVIECWDPRVQRSIAKLDMFDSMPESVTSNEITKIKFGCDGLTMCVGLSSGKMGVYDLRRFKPLYTLNHRNKIPIKDIHIHPQSSKLITCDAKSIRYWEQNNGDLYTVITPSEPINSLCVVPNSGVIFVAQEQHRIGSYYLPSVGIAPKWCPFLDNMTEELEESKYRSIYIDYKFITRTELEALGLEHLIGTSLLKPYMHGFFIDIRLYRRVRAIVDPDAYAKFLKMKTEENINSKRSNRIEIKNKLPKINRSYANYLLSSAAIQKKKLQKLQKEKQKKQSDGKISNGGDNSNNSNNSAGVQMNALVDPRFSMMFKNRDYSIDFVKDPYLNYHPEIKYAMDQMQYQHMIDEDNDDHHNHNNSDNANEEAFTADEANDSERGQRGQRGDNDEDVDVDVDVDADVDGDADGDDGDEVLMDDALNDGEQTFDDKYLHFNDEQIEQQQYAKQVQLPTLLQSDNSDNENEFLNVEEEIEIENTQRVEEQEDNNNGNTESLLSDDGWNDENLDNILNLRTLND